MTFPELQGGGTGDLGEGRKRGKGGKEGKGGKGGADKGGVTWETYDPENTSPRK